MNIDSIPTSKTMILYTALVNRSESRYLFCGKDNLSTFNFTLQNGYSCVEDNDKKV